MSTDVHVIMSLHEMAEYKIWLREQKKTLTLQPLDHGPYKYQVTSAEVEEDGKEDNAGSNQPA